MRGAKLPTYGKMPNDPALYNNARILEAGVYPKFEEAMDADIRGSRRVPRLAPPLDRWPLSNRRGNFHTVTMFPF